MKFKLFLVGLALAAPLAASGGADAACLGPYLCYDNFSAPSSGLEVVNETGLYDSFTTGRAQTIGEIDLLLSGSGAFTIEILSNSDNAPGTVLFSGEFFPSSGNDYYPTDPWSVQADTRYWIGLFSSGGSTDWSYSSDISGNGVASELWSDSTGVFANSSGHGPFQMDLGDGLVIIPEPSTWVSMLVGLGGLGLKGLRLRGDRRLLAA